MSDIKRYYIQCWSWSKRDNGNWVKYDDHRAEVKRLIAELDLALAEVKRSKDWLEVAAQVADLVGAKARTDDGKETADKIARRLRALMEEETR